MTGIIVASHGDLAKGILMSAEMIVGKQENVAACCLLPSEGPEDIKNKIMTAIDQFDSCDEILFLVDLWGGTPFNQITTLVEGNENYRVITGLNLPMLIEACMARSSYEHVNDLKKHVLETGKEGIASLEKEEENTTEVKEETSVVSEFKKGYMEYVLVRIDSRLLHGQVATGWIKSCNPDRILVVSDSVAHDELRKKMIKQAAPSGVKVHVIPLYKFVELASDDRFGGTKALVLFETVDDVIKVIEDGVKLERVNLGSIAHSEGKVVVTTAVSMDQRDVDGLTRLQELGVTMDVRKVPADSPENMDEILIKAKQLLKGDH